MYTLHLKKERKKIHPTCVFSISSKKQLRRAIARRNKTKQNDKNSNKKRPVQNVFECRQAIRKIANTNKISVCGAIRCTVDPFNKLII